MKKHELQPTRENISTTFIENTIGRNEDLKRFLIILNSLEDAYSIALDSNWGSGKTFFVKQAKMILELNNAFIESEFSETKDTILSVWNRLCAREQTDWQPQVPIYYDAWENDNDVDPIISLVYRIIQSSDNINFEGSAIKAESLLKFAASIVDAVTGRSIADVIDAAAKLTGEDVFDSIRKQKHLKELIDEFLNSLLPERGNRLVIFIDELDRCKPDYAVRLLERIKHYFNNENVTFVFSVNVNELQFSIKQCYGQDFDACKYLDRFFDLRIRLPKADLSKYFYSIGFDVRSYTYDMVAAEVINTYHMEMREISRYIQLLKIAAYSPTHDGNKMFYFFEGKGLQYGLLLVIPVMIGLFVTDTERYNRFINGDDGSPLHEVFIGKAISDRMFDAMLTKKQTFAESNDTLTHVELSDILDAFYNVLFKVEFTGSRYEYTLGELSFTAETRDILLRTASLLSPYTMTE